MTDEQIVTLFFERSENAIRETEKKYGALCRSLAGNILKDPSDAEECVSDAYLRVWNLIPPQRPKFYKAYLCKLVKRICFDRVRYNGAKKRGEYAVCLEELEELVASREDGPEGVLDREELRLAVNEFLKKQNDRARKIFLRRYWFSEPIPQIAAEMGEKEQRITAQLFRTREKLKEYLKKEGFLQ